MVYTGTQLHSVMFLSRKHSHFILSSLGNLPNPLGVLGWKVVLHVTAAEWALGILYKQQERDANRCLRFYANVPYAPAVDGWSTIKRSLVRIPARVRKATFTLPVDFQPALAAIVQRGHIVQAVLSLSQIQAKAHLKKIRLFSQHWLGCQREEGFTKGQNTHSLCLCHRISCFCILGGQIN